MKPTLMIVSLSMLTCSGMATPIQPTTSTTLRLDNRSTPLTGFTYDISGRRSFDELGSIFNEFLEVAFDSSVPIIAISWDITMTNNSASFASEAAFNILDEVSIIPAEGTDTPVNNERFISDGIVYFADLGQPNKVYATDGILSIEFYERFDDIEGQADALYEQGSTITVYTPAPSPLAAMALLLLSTPRRRTRKLRSTMPE